MRKEKVFLVDAHSFCYRAFFAIRGLSTSKGQPTGAIYGFMNILNKIVRENKPDYLGVCFDVGKKTFRTEKFKEYKINRPSMPDDLSSQIPIIKDLVSAYNFKAFEKEGFEADDVIATIAEKLSRNDDLEVYVVSADKDILQLLDKNIKIYNPYKDDVIFDQKKLNEVMGITPDKIVDMMALMGDSVDNIPGIPGIGEKTALKLIKQFGSVEGLIENIDKLDSDILKESIMKFKEQARLSRDLARLEKNVPLEIKLSEMKVKDPDKNRLISLFRELEFKSLLKDLIDEIDDQAETQAGQDLDEADLGAFTKGLNEFAFSVYSDDEEPMRSDIKGARLYSHKGTSIYINGIKKLKAIFENANIKKITHDLKFAKIVLKKAGIEINGGCFDVMLAAYVLDPGRPDYSLKALAIEYLGDASADSGKILFELKKTLGEKIKDHELENLFYNIEIPLVGVLCEMEMHGVNLDTKLLKELSKDLDEKLGILIKDIYKKCGCEINLNSPKQLREVLFNNLKLKPVKRTKTGPSTDEESLRKLKSAHPVVADILQYREFSKLKSTYIDALPKLINKNTGKVHTSFNQAKTVTGRLSSSNPNLQNIPVRTELGRTIRKAFVPTDKNDLILSADYSQVELRILAHICGDKALIDAFRKDLDIHKFTASLIFDVDEEEVDEKMRDTAKRINFGIIYGMSVYGLAKDLEIQPMVAQDFMDSYFLRYPKVKDYMEDIVCQAGSKGYVTTLLERRRYFPQIKSHNKALQQFAQRAAINAPIQGSAADMIKMAMIEISRKLKEEKLKAAMILQVHDELVFEVSKDELDKVASLVKEIMENVLKLDVPVKADLKQGKNWLQTESI